MTFNGTATSVNTQSCEKTSLGFLVLHIKLTYIKNCATFKTKKGPFEKLGKNKLSGLPRSQICTVHCSNS